MADIFISYSSKDREKAEQLTELLSSAGLSVWIDRQGIEVATSWSKEIVDGINGCKALVLLLSSSSVVSHNVIKEVSLASEKRKKIVPLDLEPVAIPPELEYQLAGIQRTSMANVNAIIAALGKIGLEATQAPVAPRITHDVKDTRKSLIIMPFDDLSPTQDNQWFADGLAGELIDLLGKIKSLRILDRKTSLGLRTVTQTTVEIGKLFNTRYFIEGSVRKFGEQIKISISLLDIETGDHLWQESYKGVMADIFDLQESVAMQVVEGLKLHLTNEEKSLLAERGTENAEAYELFIRATEYHSMQTREGYTLAAELYREAVTLDPDFLIAQVNQATSFVLIYRSYDRNPLLLDKAELICNEVRNKRPDFLDVFTSIISIALFRGNVEQAERMAIEWVEKDSENISALFILGFVYLSTNRNAEAIPHFEALLRIQPDNRPTLANLIMACDSIGDKEKCAEWSAISLPYVERHLRLHPNDENSRVWRTNLLLNTGRATDALRAIRELVDENSPMHIRDGRSLYNAACILAGMNEVSDAFRVFRQAIDAGFSYIELLKGFLVGDVSTHIGTPEYEEAKQIVDALEREAEAKKNG